MKKITLMLLIGNILFTTYLFINYRMNQNLEHDFSEDILKVKGIVVVDSFGVERAILAADLPEPQRYGNRMFTKREKERGVAGLMLYDSEGIERGGYVTDNDYGNIFLTLDSKVQQTALFLAEPDSGAAAILWGRNQNTIRFVAGDEGISTSLKENGKTIKIRNDE